MRHPSYFPSQAELLKRGSAQTTLHERACAVTRAVFGKQVFVRGVVEISNFCRQNCAYCGMRRDNRRLTRYRADVERLATMLIDHCPQCITDLNLQAGEDPVAVREFVLPLIAILRRETPFGISVCLGTHNHELYNALLAAGASIYIMKFECANPIRYIEFRAPGTLNERVQHVRWLAANGWSVSSGFIAGLPGETTEDMLSNLRLADSLPLAGCSVSPFIPGDSTPLASKQPGSLGTTLNSIAALRLMRPEWVIPAVSALNTWEDDGYRRGLRAGANLTTINLTPKDVREDYIIYKRDRVIMTEQKVLEAISAEGLVPSRQSLVEHVRLSRRESAALGAV